MTHPETLFIHPHAPACKYWGGPIGGPGCICEVVNKDELAAPRKEAERLRSVLKLAAPYIEFYAEREMRSPSNGEEAVRDTREMLHTVRAALREGKKGSE